MTPSGARYSTAGLIEAQHEPGSRGRVLRNLRGITSVREMAWAEHQEQMRALGELVGACWSGSELSADGTDLQLRVATDATECRGGLIVRFVCRPASVSATEKTTPSMAEEVQTVVAKSRFRRSGSRRYGLVRSRLSFFMSSILPEN